MKTINTILSAIICKIMLLFDQRLTIILLRKEIQIFQRQNKRPKLKNRDRLFFVFLSCIWKNWNKNLNIVKPATVIRWHKMGFKLFWRFKSRAKSPGRPKTCREIRRLIRKMAKANPTWGAPRIHGELIRLGIEISESTVSNLMPKRKKPPSPTWRAFIKNHMHNTCAMDFFTVPTATFNILFVLIILSHERRKIVHFNVTAHPTALWTAQQIKEAFPWDTAPKYMIRDRDSIYGAVVKQQIKNMGIEQVVTAFKSPWQNGFVERVIGSIRRECTDHLIVRNAVHLKRVLSEYVDYYHNDRTHLGLDKDTPERRSVQPRPSPGVKIVELPRVGGLHHRYEWQKAA